MDRLQPVAGRRYWVIAQDTEGKVVAIEEEIRHMVTEVKIAFPVSYNALTRADE
ncbi:MAG TPA: hypothetical protein VLA49_18140 [Anaerolineales bacterium]|nr:hypothetical protein [Anaerolineales bacterium]